MFEESSSGDGGARGIGAGTLFGPLPTGDRRLSLGVIGEILRDGDALTGVSCCPWGKYGRLAAEVSTLGGRPLAFFE